MDVNLRTYRSIQKACRKVMLENWTPYQASKFFAIDKSNMSAYMSGRKDFPIMLSLRLLDYHNVKLVCFKSY